MSDPYERALAIFEEAAALVDEAESALPPEATAEERKAARRAARRQRLANLATLHEQNPHTVNALWEEMQRRRERYTRNLSNKLMTSSEPVDQREIDFQRGLWFGAVLALVALPREAQDALAAARVEDDKEADA